MGGPSARPLCFHGRGNAHPRPMFFRLRVARPAATDALDDPRHTPAPSRPMERHTCPGAYTRRWRTPRPRMQSNALRDLHLWHGECKS